MLALALALALALVLVLLLLLVLLVVVLVNKQTECMLDLHRATLWSAVAACAAESREEGAKKILWQHHGDFLPTHRRLWVRAAHRGGDVLMNTRRMFIQATTHAAQCAGRSSTKLHCRKCITGNSGMIYFYRYFRESRENVSKIHGIAGK